MSVAAPVQGESFSIRIIKSLAANPSLRWANTYEVFAVGDVISTAQLVDVYNSLVQYEQELHWNGVQFLYGTISTFVPDGRPYDPDSFLRVNTGASGLRGAGVSDEIEGLDTCLRVAFTPFTGRSGFRLYRGALFESEVTAPAGYKTLVDPDVINTRLSTAITSSGLDDYLIGGTLDLAISLVGDTGARYVGAVVVQGVTTKKLNNKYFDRGVG